MSCLVAGGDGGEGAQVIKSSRGMVVPLSYRFSSTEYGQSSLFTSYEYYCIRTTVYGVLGCIQVVLVLC